MGFLLEEAVDHRPTRLRLGLGFADPYDQQMGLMTHPTLGSRVAGTVMDPKEKAITVGG